MSKKLSKTCKILPPLNTLQKEIITGSLLGDGFLHNLRNDRCNSHFAKSQTIAKKEYIKWHVDIFDEYSSGLHIGQNKPNLNLEIPPCIKYCTFRTYNQPYFTELRKKWYPQDKKIIPLDLKLSPQTIAIWFFDDGSNDKKFRAATLCTLGFSIEEVYFLVELLKNFELNPTVNIRTSRFNGKEQPLIKFNGKSYDNLINMIKPYMLWDCFQYKIDWRDIKVKNPKTVSADGIKKIIELKKYKTSKEIAKIFNINRASVDRIIKRERNRQI